MSKDFIAYANFQGFDERGFTALSLFIEPYRYVLYEFVGQFTKKQDDIVLTVYYINLIINVFFFLWVAQLKDIPVWRKMLLFSIYYITFSYVWLRASVAYILIAYLIYHDFRNRRKIIGFAALLVHLSSLPVLYLWLLRFTRPLFRPFLIIILLVITYIFLSSSYSDHITGKIEKYVASSLDKDNIKHQIYFVFFSIFVFVYFFYHKSYFKNMNVFFIYLYGFYFVTHFVNVVAAQRVSHYLLISLLLLPSIKNKKLISYRKILLVISLLFIFIFYFKFYSVINFESF